MKVHHELLPIILTGTMKTKQQEIEILEAAIQQLGPDSYLGPWLQSVAGEVERLVRCDIFPELSLKAAQEDAAVIKRNAQGEAENIIKKADDNALRIKRQANLYLDQVAS